MPVFLGAMVIFIINFAPAESIVTVFGDPTNPLTKLLCSYPMVVRGSSMEPKIHKNSTIITDRCIEDKTQLTIGTTIVFDMKPVKKITVIRDIDLVGNNLRYIVSTMADPDDLLRVSPDNIFAVVPEPKYDYE